MRPGHHDTPIPVYADVMVPVYAIALFVGFLMLLAWIVGVAIGTWVDGWEFADPESRFGALAVTFLIR